MPAALRGGLVAVGHHLQHIHAGVIRAGKCGGQAAEQRQKQHGLHIHYAAPALKALPCKGQQHRADQIQRCAENAEHSAAQPGPKRMARHIRQQNKHQPRRAQRCAAGRVFSLLVAAFCTASAALAGACTRLCRFGSFGICHSSPLFQIFQARRKGFAVFRAPPPFSWPLSQRIIPPGGMCAVFLYCLFIRKPRCFPHGQIFVSQAENPPVLAVFGVFSQAVPHRLRPIKIQNIV